MQALTERFEMRLDQDTLQAIERWRAGEPDLPSRAEAIRRLVERGLSAGASGPLRLSKAEMLITLLLCQLLEGLKVKGSFNPDFVAEAIVGGHSWALEWEHGMALPESVDRREEVTHVVDVLDMWDFLEAGYAKLGAKDKARLKTEAAPFGVSVRFAGFDGNNETNLLGIAHFLVHKMKRFTRFAGRELNSHAPSIGPHTRMLAVWKPIRERLAGRALTVDEMVEILSARGHPSK